MFKYHAVLIFLFLSVGNTFSLDAEVSVILKTAFTRLTGLGRDRPSLEDVVTLRDSSPHRNFDKPDDLICEACEIGVTLLIPIIDSKEVYPKVVEFAKWLCTEEEWFTERVCHGAVDMFKEEVFAILPVLQKSPHWTCSHYFKLPCGVDDDPTATWWNITLPPPPSSSFKISEKPLRKRNANTLQILHLSDMHLDPLFSAGSEGNCSEPLCCRADSPSPTNPAYRRPAGKFGYYACDTSPLTMNLFLSQIAEQHQIDAVYITGDLVPHDVWNQTRERHKKFINLVFDMVKKNFGNTRVFYATGNHEGIPVNAFPTPETALPQTQNMSWLYDGIFIDTLVNKMRWLPNDTAKDISHSGSYSTLFRPGWRVISINDNYCNSDNWWLYINSTDPQQVLVWLVSQLYYAEIHNERVHLIMHIPTGDSDCLKAWSYNYYNIINRFHNTIAAQFSGHTHDSYFVVYYDENYKTPLGVNYVGPSITTYMKENPAYQLLTVDSTSLEVLDYDIYYVDLSQSNLNGTFLMKKLYNAKTDLGLADLSPQSWHNLAIKMQTDDKLFEQFRSYIRRLAVPSSCDASCKSSILCELHQSRNDPDMCSHFLSKLLF